MSGIISCTAFGKSGILGPAPAFSASATTPTAGTYITFQTKYIDTHNCFDTSNGIYTAPLTGNYFVQLKSNVTYGYSAVYFRIAETNKLQHQHDTSNNHTAGWFSQQMGGIFYVKAGETIRCYCQGISSGWDAGVWNMFSGHYIGN